MKIFKSIIIDESMGRIVLSDDNDTIYYNLSQIKTAETVIEDHKTQRLRYDGFGLFAYYCPPRYKHSYEISVLIKFLSPEISDIKIDMFEFYPTDKNSEAFEVYKSKADEISLKINSLSKKCAQT